MRKPEPEMVKKIQQEVEQGNDTLVMHRAFLLCWMLLLWL
jgi:hypothetical protein